MKKLFGLILLAVMLVGCTTPTATSLTFSPDAVPDNDITSNSVPVGRVTNYSVYCALTNTDSVTGDLLLRVSNDATNWETYDTESVAAAAATKLWNVSVAGYIYFDVFWDSTSGGTTDTLTCNYHLKR